VLWQLDATDIMQPLAAALDQPDIYCWYKRPAKISRLPNQPASKWKFNIFLYRESLNHPGISMFHTAISNIYLFYPLDLKGLVVHAINIWLALWCQLKISCRRKCCCLSRCKQRCHTGTINSSFLYFGSQWLEK